MTRSISTRAAPTRGTKSLHVNHNNPYFGKSFYLHYKQIHTVVDRTDSMGTAVSFTDRSATRVREKMQFIIKAKATLRIACSNAMA